MAPPSLQTYNTFTDLEVRDIYYRQQHQVASTGNVIQKLYNHISPDGSAILSGVGLTTLDTANGNVGQYSLMLADSDKPIDATTLTTENLSSWTANSVFTVTPTDFTIRANVATTERIAAPEYRIGPSRVLYPNTLGETIINSSLRTFGEITDFNVNGTTKINNVLSRTYNISLPSEALQFEQGTLFSQITASPGGAFTVELNLIQSTNGSNSISRIYKFPVYLNATNDAWRTLLPIASSGASNENEVGILIKVNAAQTTFCIYKSGDGTGGSATDITITMLVHQNDEYPVTSITGFTAANDTALLNQGPYSAYSGTLIHQSAAADCVGINTDNPDSGYTLHVNGPVKSGTITSSTINTSGNIHCFGVVNFSYKYRFAYNAATDSLDIERNTGTLQSPVWEKTATLASL